MDIKGQELLLLPKNLVTRLTHIFFMRWGGGFVYDDFVLLCRFIFIEDV